MLYKNIKFIVFIFFIALFSCVKYERNFKSFDVSDLKIGEKIAFYANSFINTPYDRIPIGLYVDSKRIIADNEVDCMYLVFRVVELAFSDGDNKKAIQIGLDKRFRHKGILDKKSFVTNYDDRFDYSEDMIFSGKWGESIFTNEEMNKIKGSRSYDVFYYMPKEKIISDKKISSKIQTGDILFLVKKPDLRSKAGEIIGHLGVLDVVGDEIYFIHASGVKGLNKPQGKVKKVFLSDYLNSTSRFIGVYITRFKD